MHTRQANHSLAAVLAALVFAGLILVITMPSAQSASQVRPLPHAPNSGRPLARAWTPTRLANNSVATGYGRPAISEALGSCERDGPGGLCFGKQARRPPAGQGMSHAAC
jgi:hypothetical protein